MSDPRPPQPAPLDVDLVRDALAGRLSQAERDDLVARRGADPELNAMARDLEALDRVESAADFLAVPACAVTFDKIRPALSDTPADDTPVDGALERRPVLSRWAPFVAAAAAVLVLLGGVLLRRAESGPVEVRAIALEAGVPLPPLPRAALDYEPSGSSGLRFVEGVAAGKALAAATGRPLVIFVHHPTCPVCVALERGPFRDPALAPAAGEFVLARASVMKDGQPLLAGLSGDWPVFVVFRADGERVDAFGGGDGMRARDARKLAASLEAAAKSAQPAGSPTTPAPSPAPWAEVHAVARALADADASKDAADRWRRFADAESAAKSAALSERVRAARAAATDAARLALSVSKALADAGLADQAVTALDKAAAAYRGTPVEDDLRRVRERLVSDGRFPALEAAR